MADLIDPASKHQKFDPTFLEASERKAVNNKCLNMNWHWYLIMKKLQGDTVGALYKLGIVIISEMNNALTFLRQDTKVSGKKHGT